MEGPIKERDWKYMRSIYDELLQALCARINAKAVDLATAEGKNPSERYHDLHRHVLDSDKVIADCFDDWRRSTIQGKIFCLRHDGLLLDSHLEGLSDSAQEWLAKMEEMGEV